MNKKNKKTKIKRIVALLGVVVILVSALVFPAGAWEKTDISFYNYFDVSKIPTISATKASVGIMSVNSNTGDIRYKFYTNKNDTYQVNYQALNLRLCDVCPEMEIGNTYVFSQYFTSSDKYVKPLDYLYLKVSPDAAAYKVDFGKPFMCTSEILNAYIILCAGRFPNDAGKPVTGTAVETTQKIWVNKGFASVFEPYDLFKNIQDTYYDKGKSDGYNSGLATGNEQGYDKGYAEGYNNGLNFNIMDNLAISKNNVSVLMRFKDTRDGSMYDYSYQKINYPFNGYSFNTKFLSDDYLIPPNEFSFIKQFQVIVIPKMYGNNYVVGESGFTFIPYQRGVYVIRVYSEKFDDPLKYKEVSRMYDHSDLDKTVSLDFEQFGLAVGDEIEAISIELVAKDGSYFQGFSFAFTDTSDNAFVIGVEEGKSQGYATGYEEGIAKGTAEGYQKGFDEGVYVGYGNGYKEGDNDGYYRGRADESENDSFFSMIYSVIDAPVSILAKTLDFNILGVNMLGLSSSLITFAILVTVVKYFVSHH